MRQMAMSWLECASPIGEYSMNKPGKSPMGMDLVPVYADGGVEKARGTVKIDPNVINNLGVRTAQVEKGK